MRQAGSHALTPIAMMRIHHFSDNLAALFGRLFP
jgi:hypothetical protein